MYRYIYIALVAIVLTAGCQKEPQSPFEIGEAVLDGNRVRVEIHDGAGQRVGIGILIVEDSPFFGDADPLDAALVTGGLRVSGNPVRVEYGEIKVEYFPTYPETCREIGQLGRNRTADLPSWLIERIKETGLKCVYITEGAGTADDPRAKPTFWVRTIQIPAEEPAVSNLAPAEEPVEVQQLETGDEELPEAGTETGAGS